MDSITWNQCMGLVLCLMNGQTNLSWEFIETDLFIQFCKYHNIIPQVYLKLLSSKSLRNDQTHLLKKLKYFYYQNLLRCKSTKKRLLDIILEFKIHHIESLVFKGQGLSLLLYENDYSRSFKDIDILVNQKDLIKAKAILIQLNYQEDPSVFHLSKFQKKLHTIFFKDCSFYPENNNESIELHWNLTLFSNKITDFFVTDTMKIILDGIEINTLSLENYFIYLCTHGAISFWSSLHWLLDIKDFYLKYREIINWELVLHKSRSINFDRCIGQALYLLDYFFAISSPEPINQYNKNHKKIKRLAQYIIDNFQQQTLMQNKWVRYLSYYPLLFPKIFLVARLYCPFFINSFFYISKTIKNKFKNTRYILSRNNPIL